jgi:hypothetical protein
MSSSPVPPRFDPDRGGRHSPNEWLRRARAARDHLTYEDTQLALAQVRRAAASSAYNHMLDELICSIPSGAGREAAAMVDWRSITISEQGYSLAVCYDPPQVCARELVALCRILGDSIDFLVENDREQTFYVFLGEPLESVLKNYEQLSEGYTI